MGEGCGGRRGEEKGGSARERGRVGTDSQEPARTSHHEMATRPAPLREDRPPGPAPLPRRPLAAAAAVDRDPGA